MFVDIYDHYLGSAKWIKTIDAEFLERKVGEGEKKRCWHFSILCMCLGNLVLLLV